MQNAILRKNMLYWHTIGASEDDQGFGSEKNAGQAH